MSEPRTYSSAQSKGRGHTRGAAAVEFALLAPVLFALLLGTIEFGVLLSARTTVAAAARDGARLASLQQSESVARAAAVKDLQTALHPYTVTFSCEAANGSNCTLGPSASGGTVTATVTMQYTGLTGFFGSLLTMNVSKSEVMRIE